MTTLPTELVEHITSFLDGVHDRATLLSCCLVSRSWVQSSQKHLFRRIRLSSQEFSQSRYPEVSGVLCHLLHESLLESPHLADYVRTLEILDVAGFYWSWVAVEPSLSQLLPKLSALRSLSLAHLDWNLLSEDRQQSLLALLAQPTLISLHLNRCRFPPSLHFFSAAPSLKRLSISPQVER